LPLRLPYGRMATDRGPPHRAAAHRPQRPQLRALLLLRRRQGQARLHRPHKPAGAAAEVRGGGRRRHGRGGAQPTGDLERGALAGEPRGRSGEPAGPRAPAGAGGVSAMTETAHVSVMPNEVLEHLAPRPGAWYVDTTFGAGGHTRLLLGRGANVLAIDQDPTTTAFLEGEQAWQGARSSGRLRFASG